MAEGPFRVRVLLPNCEEATDLPDSWPNQEEAEGIANAAVALRARAAVVRDSTGKIVFAAYTPDNPYGGFSELEFASLGIQIRDIR